ncbi:bifunctional DNA primase/polymerase [Nocardiopsis sp. NPDC057823]|uniref:bifunctional DNA primase/polymerase n=1 Tax=Nocardiopsis sp. NPDC057823 TaxID=3346256 RepID=UPI0036721163
MNDLTIRAAERYDETGWQVVPVNGKTLAVKGRTGRTGSTESVMPTGNQNIAIRLPRGVIGIDVDAYGDKPGADTLRRLADKLGPLPETDRSGSREAPSGIYLFRVPEDFESIGELPGIEIIQHHHRYMVVEPSIHPDTGQTYRWETVGETPMWESGPDALPKLPDAWADFLRKTNAVVPQRRSEDATDDFLTGGVPCDEVTRVLDRYNDRTGNGESRYGSMIAAQYRLMKLGEDGHPGVGTAMDTLEGLYLSDVDGERDATGEFNRGLTGLYLIADEPLNDGDPCERDPRILPDRLWNSRDSLRHIRTAAHAQTSSADVVLYSTLARLSSAVHHGVRVVTGVKSPASLNLYVAVVGRTGAGKSSGGSASRDVLGDIANPEYRELGLGSGEGMIEAFMGDVFEETGETTKDGKPKVARVRKQVRHNALFVVDEGHELNKVMERTGSTVAPIMRSAWVGETMGQANARQENSRNLPAGSYALGLIVGYQVNTAAALLTEDEINGGTPQRFLWAWATDPNIPRKRIDHPGELKGHALDGSFFPGNVPPLMHFPDDLKDQMWEYQWKRATSEESEENPLDAHSNLMRAKVAALLALLEGRYDVNHEDWELSGIIWDTSCAVRDFVHAEAIETAKREKERASAERIREAERTALATTNIGAKNKQLAKALTKKVEDSGGIGSSELRKTLHSKKRPLFADAIEYAETQGWVSVDENGFITPVK